MSRKLYLGTTALCGLVVTLMPAFAQELEGLQATFGVEQRFEAGDNLSLDIPESGSSAFSTTAFDLNVLSQTRTQSLRFNLGAALRYGDVEPGVDTGLVDPNIGFNYARTGANALFSFGASYAESDVSFDRSLSDFEDENGVIVLPDDFEGLNGTGTREVARANARIETGLQDPIGFVFFVDGAQTTYRNLSAGSSLDDFERLGAGGSILFRFSSVTTAFIDAEYNRFTSDNTEQTDRRTTSLSVGADHAISPTTRIVGSIGYSETDTEEFGVSEVDEGIIGSLTWSRDLSSGSVETSFDVTQNENGRRATLLFARMMPIPLGSLSYSIGVTDSDTFDANVVGSLNWQRNLPTGRMFARLDRQVSSNSEDEERLFTTVALGYLYDINSVSSIGFDASYGASEFDNANDVNRTDLSISYNHALTQDWTLSSGVSYRIRDEQNVGEADSQSIFVTLRREFDLLR